MSFHRYPAYKPSGVEWLGDVPEHWQEKPLKTITSINDEVLPESLSPDYEIEYVDIGSVSLANGIEKTEAMPFGDAPSRARRIPRDGDVLVSTVRTYLKAIAPVVNPPLNLVASTGFAIVRPGHELEPGFLKYALQEEHFIQQVISRSTGVSYPAINASDVAKISLNLPGPSEQLAIATFLDNETAKIDALIAEQQRLIELLQEKRQAVISHAVTKGLNPDAPMKDSGVEWLGEVPEHWEVRRLKNLLTRPLQYGANEAAELDDTDLPRFVRITDIDETGRLRDDTFHSLPHDIAAPYLLEDGDVLLARSGATVGKSFTYSREWGTACFAGYLIRARMREVVCRARWLHFYCQTLGYWAYVGGSQIQATIQNVSAEKYASLWLPVPPPSEQDVIMDKLAATTNELENLTAEAMRAIILLQERRSALISAAVTGQIDVRGLVPEAVAA